MVTEADTDDFDVDACLCQGAVPLPMRIDVQDRLPVLQNGQPVHQNGKPVFKWKTWRRFHKQCPIHGIEVTYATRTES